ncbi:hypothetical protein PFISCL1PPCAC_26767, partial [Pristionchus fissidentatus]
RQMAPHTMFSPAALSASAELEFMIINTDVPGTGKNNLIHGQWKNNEWKFQEFKSQGSHLAAA